MFVLELRKPVDTSGRPEAKLGGQAQGQHVPGSRAQSVDPLQVLRELGTLVFEDSGNFGSFSRSCFRTARPLVSGAILLVAPRAEFGQSPCPMARS